jgi:orotidine-5'-phosphate decarboxylase
MMSAAKEKFNHRAQKINSLLCVGLDPDFGKLPEKFKGMQNPQFEFNKWIIDQTAEFAAAFKPNVASYEVRDAEGWKELQMTARYIHENYPDIFTICDAKRADIGYTSELYAQAILDNLDFDAVTLHPYLGMDAIKPFLDRRDKVSIILCRTSNPGAGELQDLEFTPSTLEGEGLRERGKKLWQVVAHKVSRDWNYNHNCMLVVGATYPAELGKVREIVGEMSLLVPGIGTQGGSVEEVMKAGLNSAKRGLIINSSKGIIFAQDPKAEAKKLRDEINKYR